MTSRDSSRDGFRSFRNGIPKLMKKWRFPMLRNSALHFCSVLGIAGDSGIHFPKFLDSYSEAVEFLGYRSAAKEPSP